VLYPHPVPPPSKTALRDELIALLSADLSTLERAQQAAAEGATHEEAKPENDKDTRALEQSYLARGQAARVEELRAGLAEVSRMPVRAFGPEEPAALGALVTIEEGEAATLLFLAPHGGGSRLCADGARAIQVVTPKSPLGRALLGKRAGEDAEVPLAGRVREIVVSEIR
jgi:transcription elongation GreA/GreB family factor